MSINKQFSFQATNSKYHPHKSSHGKKLFQETPPVASIKNKQLFNMRKLGSKVVTYRNLDPCEPEYGEVCNAITNKSIIVGNIVKIKNPFLKKAFALKKQEKYAIYDHVEEVYLFHGTKKENVESICRNNFNWRLYGQSTGHRFGKGVSFSPNAKYASNYSDKYAYHKVMIVAKVLIANACQGNKGMELPLPGHDTSQKDDGIVVVKYEDNEFLPVYKIYYHIDEDYYHDHDDNVEDYYGDQDDNVEDYYDDNVEDYYDDIVEDYYDDNVEDYYDDNVEDYYNDNVEDYYDDHDYNVEDYYDDHDDNVEDYYDDEDYYNDYYFD